MFKKFKISALFVCGALIGSVATYQLSAAANSPTPNIPLEELRAIAQVFEQVKEGYVKPQNDKKLWDAAIKGMVTSLDPHSSYLDEKEYKELRISTEGRFAGLGIEVTHEDGLVKVIAPIEDTPAFRAGIRPGDFITRVNDKPVRSMSLERAVKLMRGEPKTKVTLTIFRKSEERSFDLTIERAIIRTQSVKAKWINPDYLWIRVTTFQQLTVKDFAERIGALLKAHPTSPKGIVLDLRNNGGGILQSAIGISSVFLPPDALITSTKGQIPEANQSFKARAADYYLAPMKVDPLKSLPPILKTVPLVVLVSPYSASASEIVAGALQDHKRAKIMGKTTFGKGSVQIVKPLTKDTALRLTTAYYYTPSGRSIQDKGVVPDLMVDLSADGDPYEVLITREVDLQNHLANLQDPDEKEEASEREQLRFEKMRQFEQRLDKMTPEQRQQERNRKPPEFGELSKDFMLRQAINFLNGQPVQLSVSKEKSAKKIETAKSASNHHGDRKDNQSNTPVSKPPALPIPAKPN